MLGVIKTVTGRNYGFVRDPLGIEHFFHREDFLGNWDQLFSTYSTSKRRIEVEFDVVDSPKGPRAANVKIIGG